MVGAAEVIPEAGTPSMSVSWTYYISIHPILYLSATFLYSLLIEDHFDFT